MFNTNLTAEQRLQKAVIDIMANPKYVALAGVMMIGSRKIVENLPTACTNGRDEFYGRAFVDSLNDAQLRFLVLHEVYHKLYRHLTTWKWMWDDHPQMANVACDYVINVKIVDDNGDRFATMDGPLAKGCYDEKYRGWDSAQVFRDLKKKYPPQGGQGEGQGQPGSGQSGSGQPGSGQPGSGQGQGDMPEGFDEHDWEGAQGMSEAEKRELARDIDEAVRQGAMAAGKMGTGGDRDMAELLEPQVNWREALREFVASTCAGSDYSTWKKPNRRYVSAGIYMPSGISERVGEIVIAPDMSGSTFSPHMMSAIMSEVKGIAESVKAERVRLLYWDTEVCRDETYEADELDGLINATVPAGGGGTMVECVPKYMEDKNIKPQAVIVLTDGYLGGSWGSWSQPVLWVVADNKSANPAVGKTLHIKSRNM